MFFDEPAEVPDEAVAGHVSSVFPVGANVLPEFKRDYDVIEDVFGAGQTAGRGWCLLELKGEVLAEEGHCSLIGWLLHRLDVEVFQFHECDAKSWVIVCRASGGGEGGSGGRKGARLVVWRRWEV